MPLVRITAMPRLLLKETGHLVDHRRLREAAINGRFAAEQINGLWHVHTDELPQIAAAFGLAAAKREHPEGSSAAA